MADKLSNSDVPEISHQDDVDSYPLRTIHANLKNKVNEVIDDLAAVAIGTTNAETTAGRPYHTNLKERLDSNSHTYLKSGGALTEQGTPDMTVAVAAGEARVNGIDVKWAAQNSGTITAPVSDIRLDYVVVNSDATLSVVTGTLLAAPIFPAVASTQIVIGCLVVKAATTSLNDDVEIFNLRHNASLSDKYIPSSLTLGSGTYTLNNIIIDAAVTIDINDTSNVLNAVQREIVSFNCFGNFEVTALGSITKTSSTGPVSNMGDGNSGSGNTAGTASSPGLKSPSIITSLASGIGGNGGRFTVGDGGGGGGGGASWSVAGGAGGTGAGSTTGSGTVADAGGIDPGILIVVTCYDFRAFGNITNSGDTQAVTTSGGSGGSAGGTLAIFAKNDVEINTGITITLAGGDGSDANGGNRGGGGGGGGGLFLVRSASYTNNGTIALTPGTGGSPTSSSAAGSAGTTGTTDQKVTTDDFTDLLDNGMPLNMIGIRTNMYADNNTL